MNPYHPLCYDESVIQMPSQPLVAEIPTELGSREPTGLIGWWYPERPEERKASDMTLGERIQTCRRRIGLSQEALAEQLGVSRQAVSKWEVDAAQPELDKAVALSKVFGITTDQLLLGGPSDPGPPTATAPEKREPRWYLLGLLPLAVGCYLLIRGVLQLSAVSGLLEFARLPGFLS